jgi:hypothetical protein
MEAWGNLALMPGLLKAKTKSFELWYDGISPGGFESFSAKFHIAKFLVDTVRPKSLRLITMNLIVSKRRLSKRRF